MSEPKTFPVYDETGCIGVLLAPARFLDSRPEKTIRLNNGEEIRVPGAALRVQPDGSFRLLRSPEEARGMQASTAPDAAPVLQQPRADNPDNSTQQPAARRQGAANGQAAAAAQPAPAQPAPAPESGASRILEGAFFQDDYDIERVEVGQVIDGPVMQRHEGDTLVLPVVEEVLVFQKRLYLREEIRITRRKKPVSEVRKLEQPEAKPVQ